jgi:hypothetical protein
MRGLVRLRSGLLRVRAYRKRKKRDKRHGEEAVSAGHCSPLDPSAFSFMPEKAFRDRA